MFIVKICPTSKEYISETNGGWIYNGGKAAVKSRRQIAAASQNIAVLFVASVVCGLFSCPRKVIESLRACHLISTCKVVFFYKILLTFPASFIVLMYKYKCIIQTETLFVCQQIAFCFFVGFQLWLHSRRYKMISKTKYKIVAVSLPCVQSYKQLMPLFYFNLYQRLRPQRPLVAL